MKIRLPTAVIMVLAAVIGTAAAVPVVSNTWDSSTEGWLSDTGPESSRGGAGSGHALANDAGTLGITVGDPGGSPLSDFIYGTGSGGATNVVSAGGGIWTTYTNYSLHFDFYSQGAAPDKLSLYFMGGGATWYYDIGGLGAGWSMDLAANLSYNWGSGWYRLIGTDDETSFNSSLGSVSEVGLWINYRQNGDQYYRLDNFNLNDEPFVPIPEPGTCALFGFSLISLGITFRRRLREKLSVLPWFRK